MKLKEIADRISKYLEGFEKKGLKGYYEARAYAGGNRVFVAYIDFQYHDSLKKQEAEEYLKWLDEGNEGKHFKMKRKEKANEC